MIGHLRYAFSHLICARNLVQLFLARLEAPGFLKHLGLVLQTLWLGWCFGSSLLVALQLSLPVGRSKTLWCHQFLLPAAYLVHWPGHPVIKLTKGRKGSGTREDDVDIYIKIMDFVSLVKTFLHCVVLWSFVCATATN